MRRRYRRRNRRYSVRCHKRGLAPLPDCLWIINPADAVPPPPLGLPNAVGLLALHGPEITQDRQEAGHRRSRILTVVVDA